MQGQEASRDLQFGSSESRRLVLRGAGAHRGIWEPGGPPLIESIIWPPADQYMSSSSHHHAYDTVCMMRVVGFLGSLAMSNALQAYSNSLQGVMNILGAIMEAGLMKSVRFFEASSCEVFGKHQDSVCDEGSAMRPQTPYGRAKLLSHLAVKHYRQVASEQQLLHPCLATARHQGSTAAKERQP